MGPAPGAFIQAAAALVPEGSEPPRGPLAAVHPGAGLQPNFHPVSTLNPRGQGSPCFKHHIEGCHYYVSFVLVG